MPKHNRKGRSKSGGQFVKLLYILTASPAWRSLSGSAVKVYIELHSRYNGRNNGDLSLSYSEAARLLKLGKTTVKRAFDELTEKGLILKMREGHWYGRRAATWAVTDSVIDIPKASPATNAWKEWPPISKN